MVLVELAIRAERWRILLGPSAQVPVRSALAYLSVGYFANTILPARLGEARCLIALKQLEEARKVLEGVLPDHPADLTVRLELSRVYARMASDGYLPRWLEMREGPPQASIALWIAAVFTVAPSV